MTIFDVPSSTYFRVVLATLCGFGKRAFGLGNVNIWPTLDNVEILKILSSCLTIIECNYLCNYLHVTPERACDTIMPRDYYDITNMMRLLFEYSAVVLALLPRRPSRKRQVR